MQRGVSPVVATVLLISIAVIGSVAIYYWTGGIATQQPTTGKPTELIASCIDGTIIVWNNDVSQSIDADVLDHTQNVGTFSKNTTGPISCSSAGVGTLAPGDSCVYAKEIQGIVYGVIYGPKIGSAGYFC